MGKKGAYISVRFRGSFQGWSSHYSWVSVIYTPQTDKVRVVRRWKQTCSATGVQHAPSVKSIANAMPEILSRARWTYENVTKHGNHRPMDVKELKPTDGPHRAELCERCTHLGRPCSRKRAVK